ncbi:MAG: hypothetical protein KF687_07365 [Cyclobacteriaceae bacterium]|nr:hypothetical protein [Cyclobacteriaceae bacterium]
MTQQPDNLFRDKLEHFQLKPSAEAWNRIEVGLTKHPKRPLWLKVAASLVMLAVASVMLWYISSTQEHQSIITAQNENDTESIPVTDNIIDNTTATEGILAIEKEQASTPVIKGNPKKVIVSHNHQLAVIETLTNESFEAESLSVETLLAQIDSTEAESSTGVYIVLTADEVNQKYLRQEPEHEATYEEKKTSRIQMLMTVAHNLKDGEYALSDLRQMKDEIFALNFIDKKKQQPKKN